MPNEHVRAWIYRVLLALQPIIVAYNVATDEQSVLWLSLAAALLSTGLASANTSTKTPEV